MMKHAVKDASKDPAAANDSRLDRMIGSIQILLETAARLKGSPFAEVAVEVTFLKLARLEDPAALEDVIRTLAEIEKGGGTARPQSAARPAAPSIPIASAPRFAPAPVSALAPRGSGAPGSEPRAPLDPAAPAGSSPTEFRRLASLWDQIQIELEREHPGVAPFVRESTPAAMPGSADTFIVEVENEFYLRQMKTSARQEAFLSVVREVTGAPWKVRVEQGTRVARAAGAVEAAPGPGPSGQGASGGTEGARAAPASPPRSEGISKNPIVRKSVDLFGGRLV
jgi:hypothetical protein